MATGSRPSPRKSIQRWLEATSGDANFPELANCTDQHARKDEAMRLLRSSRHHYRFTSAPPEDEIVPRARLRSRRVYGEGFKDQSMMLEASRLDDRGSAERLRLHSPFRTLDSGRIEDRSEAHRQAHYRNRKRKHSVSSTSTYLQSADFLKPKGTRRRGDEPPCRRLTQAIQPYHANSGSVFSSDTPHSSNIADALPPEPLKTYERRPRHRTREDRYELKETKNSKRKHTDSKGKKSRTRKGRGKSGTAPLDKFTAKNVGPDRLTLRPAAKLGLFTKGRASSPVRRRGLPDLTFSEMTFLNTRRDQPGNSIQPVDAKRKRTKHKTVDTEEAISRFFASTRAPLMEKYSNESNIAQNVALADANLSRKRQERYSSTGPSLIPSIDLPDKPFLGFGERGPRPASPLEYHDNVSKMTHRHRHSGSFSPRPTSYYSWSQSGNMSHKSVRDTGMRLEKVKSPTRPLDQVPTGSETGKQGTIYHDASAKRDTYSTAPAKTNMKDGIRHPNADGPPDMRTNGSTSRNSFNGQKPPLVSNEETQAAAIMKVPTNADLSVANPESPEALLPEAIVEQQKLNSFAAALDEPLDDYKINIGESNPPVSGASAQVSNAKTNHENHQAASYAAEQHTRTLRVHNSGAQSGDSIVGGEPPHTGYASNYHLASPLSGNTGPWVPNGHGVKVFRPALLSNPNPCLPLPVASDTPWKGPGMIYEQQVQSDTTHSNKCNTYQQEGSDLSFKPKGRSSTWGNHNAPSYYDAQPLLRPSDDTRWGPWYLHDDSYQYNNSIDAEPELYENHSEPCESANHDPAFLVPEKMQTWRKPEESIPFIGRAGDYPHSYHHEESLGPYIEYITSDRSLGGDPLGSNGPHEWQYNRGAPNFRCRPHSRTRLTIEDLVREEEVGQQSMADFWKPNKLY